MKGYRAFGISREGLLPVGSGMVTGVHINGRPAVCVIPTALGKHGPAPQKDCGCGFYALKELDRSLHGFVVVEVEGYGTIQEHERGFRAEFMDVTAIYWPDCLQCGRAAIQIAGSAYCGTCVPLHYPPLAEYLGKLKEQYDCEIKEAIDWTSVSTYQPLPNPGQFVSGQSAHLTNLLTATTNAMRAHQFPQVPSVNWYQPVTTGSPPAMVWGGPPIKGFTFDDPKERDARWLALGLANTALVIFLVAMLTLLISTTFGAAIYGALIAFNAYRAGVHFKKWWSHE